MARILLTGGTGMLGHELVPRLLAAGYTVRVMSRRGPKPDEDSHVEWAQAHLESGDGLAEAVAGSDIILHAATSTIKRRVDVDGTGLLLDHARMSGVEHFLYISIVGIDQIGFSYYRSKLEAERLVEASAVPWSILRAAQFHYLIDKLIYVFTRLPLALIPADWQFQTMATSEVADHLLAAAQAGPSGRLPDIGGPEVLRMDNMTRLWMAAKGVRRPIVPIPFPGKLSAGFRQGLNTTPQNRAGKITWAQWLATRYPRPAGNRATMPEGATKGRGST